ncbi:MAG TPA: hypothetical protein VFJ72_04300 [Rubrobacteraceae bacterium]|nr:hypothetical protein [Rubrobacteraceae bacterium]
METFLLRQFQREIERQCQFAMIALQDIEESSANSDGKLFWYSIQNLLVAIGRISRLLWPPDESASERGAELRASLGVGDDSPLKSRTYVEHFENFDERLMDWYETSEHHRYFDSYTEPLDILAETKGGDRFRGYDTEKNAILFHSEPYYLGPISEAVEVLCQRAEQEMQKPRFDLDPEKPSARDEEDIVRY